MAFEKHGFVTSAATTRRQFTGLLCAGGLLNLAGCGGGNTNASTTPALVSPTPGVEPQTPVVLPQTPAVAPQITLAPQSASFALGQSITLRAEASGSGLAYQWHRNGVALNGATGSSLQIVAAPADDGAQYSLRVSNAAGQVESTAATLTLIAASEVSLLAGAIGGISEIVDGEGAQTRFAYIGASCLDKDGNLYVIETGAKTLRKITPAGTVSTLCTNFPSEGGVAVDADGYFYAVRDRAIIKVSPSGNQQVWAGQTGGLGFADGVGASARFARPMGLTFDAQGNLLVGDSPELSGVAGLPPYSITYSYGSTIRKISPAGVVSTVAGTPGQVSMPGLGVDPDPDSNFIDPTALACDGGGRVWVRDRSGVRRIDTVGAIPVRIWSNKWAGSMAYAAGSSGDVYVNDVSQGSTILKLGAGGFQALVVGWVNQPAHILLGELPASLGNVSFIISATARVLYVGSDNAVLRIQLS